MPPPSTVSRGAPPALDRVVLKMLERDPAHRYANCGEVARALAPFAGGRAAVVAFRKALGLQNPSERFKGGGAVTEGQGMPSPLASPAPRVTPGTTRQRAPRPRSVPPVPPPAVPSADLASSNSGTEEHDAMSSTAPALQAVGPRFQPGMVSTGSRTTSPERDRVTDFASYPAQRPKISVEPKTFITMPGAPTTESSGDAYRPPQSITDPEGGRPIEDEPHTVQSVAKRRPQGQRWWLMALAGIAALGLGAGSALAFIKMFLGK